MNWRIFWIFIFLGIGTVILVDGFVLFIEGDGGRLYILLSIILIAIGMGLL